MAAVGAADSRDPGRVAGCREPIVDGRPNAASLNRRLAGTVMAGDQQDQALAGRDSIGKRAVDRLPGLVQIHPVKVDDPVRARVSRPQPAIPPAIERIFGKGSGD